MIEMKPDIAFVVEKLNQFCHDSSVKHKKTMNEIMKYFKNTTDLMLVFDFSTLNHFINYSNATYKND